MIGATTGSASEHVTVVIITRNEEQAIERCLASVTAELGNDDAEIILVDSASTDHTLERAGKFPVTILRLTEEGILSPAAGRCVGTRHARGRFVLFLDGDMILAPGWIAGALQEFEHPKLGALAGRIYNVPLGEEPTLRSPDTLPLGDVECIGGAGLYRREALDAVGTFNPYMRGEEERELGCRLTGGGYVLRRREVPMAFHQVKPRSRHELDEKAGYFVGVGQIMREYGWAPITRQVLLSQAPALTMHLGFLGAPFVAAGLWLLGFHVAAAILGCCLLAGGILLAAVKGWRRVALFGRFSVMMVVHTARGVRVGLRNPADFDPEVTIVKKK